MALLPLTESNLISYWLRSGATWQSVEKHRSHLQRYLGWLAERGVEGIPPRRAASWLEARDFALADNLISLQILQLNPLTRRSERAHQLRNHTRIRPWH